MKTDFPAVLISVQDGVATCRSKPQGVVVIIDDEDIPAENGKNPRTYAAADEGDGC